MGFIFRVMNASQRPSNSANSFSLIRDSWDDYGFKTLFALHFTDTLGASRKIGSVKIATPFMDPDGGRTELPPRFERRPNECFSVGQDRDYYENLRNLGSSVAAHVLRTLGDIAMDEQLAAEAQRYEVTETSLMRNLDSRLVSGQFRRIANGGDFVEQFRFSYDHRPNRVTRLHFDFAVDSESTPSTNVHAVIGSNGVGKTTLLSRMSRDVLTGSDNFRDRFQTPYEFVNLVTVAFSPFDPFGPDVEGVEKMEDGSRFAHVGLKKKVGGQTRTKSDADLASDFASSLEACISGSRKERWLEAIEILGRDPILRDARLADLADHEASKVGAAALEAFKPLSSGHKIVLLTVTRLVECVEERSLVLIDEPESHLHPPLLSSLIRFIAHLMEQRNGVALVATHSPVVLQEIPASCVWELQRVGDRATVDQPEGETFAEGVGLLTRRVFDLEVTGTGYHRMLEEALASNHNDYEATVAQFSGQIGGEGRAILRSLAASRSKRA